VKELQTMSRWSEARERNRAAVASNAERVLADTTYDRFRTPRALLALVVAYVVTTIAMPACWLVWGSIAGIVAFAPWLAVFLLMRVAVRSQADLPDDVLDERMRSERDRVYVGAYRMVSSVVFLAANVGFAAVAFGDGNESITFDYESMSAVYWTVFSLLLGSPSVVLAVRQRSFSV
jgi:hypothetical protein